MMQYSHNKLTDHCTKHVGDLLTKNKHLVVLFMRWNFITSKGAMNLARALSNNESLQILDASFNAFGSNTIIGDGHKFPCVGRELGKMFSLNRTLIHMDLSHNNLSRDDCQAMQQGFKLNHTLLGLHLSGNQVDLDPKGFIVEAKNQDPSQLHILCRIGKDLETGAISESRVELDSCSNCWICEGWSEVLFSYDATTAQPDIPWDPNMLCYLHLSIDNYKPDLMEPKYSRPGVYSLRRMIPPRRVEYYFSLCEAPMAQQGKTQFSSTFLGKKAITVPGQNYIKNVIQTRTLIDRTYLEDLSVLPRPEKKLIKGMERPRTPWEFKNSVFKDYRQDNSALLN